MQHRTQRIEILSDIVAKQIAAGEVIDRPASVLRELLDNSIDSGADKIEVEVLHHGINLIQVSDNGSGISKEDLQKASLPHATSKITRITDLDTLSSLGFRGEALSSIAAVADLTIISKTPDAPQAWQVQIRGTEISTATKAVRNNGTLVRVEHLFQHLSSRRLFLSTPQAELLHLKHMFFSKAASEPKIQFTFKSESQHIHIQAEDMTSRAIRICSPNLHETDFITIHNKTVSHQDHRIILDAILGLPHIGLRNRKHIHIYINKRPVKEFKILQAVEYAYRKVLFGKYPQCVLFLQIPPHLVDVNIHPKKEEVKIRSIQQVRHLVVSSIEDALSHINSQLPQLEQDRIFKDISEMQETSDSVQKEDNPTHSAIKSYEVKHTQKDKDINNSQEAIHRTFQSSRNPSSTSVGKKIGGFDSASPRTQYSLHTEIKDLQAVLENPKSSVEYKNETNQKPYSIRTYWDYIGKIFKTYLVFEHKKDELLIMLDFHATHERVLYELLCQKTKHNVLLVPVQLSLEIDEQNLDELIASYTKMGIIISQHNTHIDLDAIPSHAPLSADEIADTIETLTREGKSPSELDARLFASRACKKAVKAGDHIDTQSAYALLEQALGYEIPRCPHGRPLWIELKKQELDKLIGRIH